MNLTKILFLTVVILFVTSCSNSSSQVNVSNYLQTQNAKLIKEHYSEILKLLLEYKIKLDKRNPNSYNKKLVHFLNKNIELSNNISLYSKNHPKFTFYYEYLNYSLKDNFIQNRNDYLIVGIYKMIYDVYQMKSTHKFTAFEYDVKKFQKVYQYLQVLQWKIKHKKDKNGNFLFLTWQNNWQVEYLKKLNKDNKYRLCIDDITYLKEKKETLLDPSNTTFEVLLSSMILHVNQTMKLLGAEPEELAIESILSLVLFI